MAKKKTKKKVETKNYLRGDVKKAKSRRAKLVKYAKENPIGIVRPGLNPRTGLPWGGNIDWENWTEEDWSNPENIKLLEEIGYETHPSTSGGGDGPPEEWQR